MTRLFLALLALTAPAIASAPQTPPEPALPRGCAIVLPDPSADDPGGSVTLRVRTTRPLSECNGSAPVSFGASIRDEYPGRER